MFSPDIRAFPGLPDSSGVGICAIGGTALGFHRILCGIRTQGASMRLWSVVSLCGPSLAALVGGIYLLVGFASASVYSKYPT
jgi:hypothetical protein